MRSALPARLADLEQRAGRVSDVERQKQELIGAGPQHAPHQVRRTLRQQREQHRPRRLRGPAVQVIQRQLLFAVEDHHLHVGRSPAVAGGRSARRSLEHLELGIGQRRERALDLRPPRLVLADQQDSQRSATLLALCTQHGPSLLTPNPSPRNAACSRQACSAAAVLMSSSVRFFVWVLDFRSGRQRSDDLRRHAHHQFGLGVLVAPSC